MVAALLFLAVVTLFEVLSGRPYLATFVGRAFAAAVRAKPSLPLVTGPHVVFVAGRRAPAWLRVVIDPAATCVGRVVIFWHGGRYRSAPLERHEVTHARQAGRYGTIPFLLVYVASWAWALLRTRNARDAYYRIPFEVAAFRAQYGREWRPPA